MNPRTSTIARRPARPALLRRAWATAVLLTGCLPVAAGVNEARSYPQAPAPAVLHCVVDPGHVLGRIDPRIFGTNLEWFNEAGGFASRDPARRAQLGEGIRAQGITVLRFPGGTLADYYHWRDAIGAPEGRPVRRHPTDPGSSANGFGSPEFFRLLDATGTEGLITVNAGTGTAEEAADWVRYARAPGAPERARDGHPAPARVPLWEIGNELYLPGNPGEVKITVTPEVYAERYLAFARAMRAADPEARLVAIGVASAKTGPDTHYPDWTRVLLAKAAEEIDMVAVHNAYFPFLWRERQPDVALVYPALWASPEAVDRSLDRLEGLIRQYEGRRHIGIAITEWGMLFSHPGIDNAWVDHVKTMGSGVYVARMLQVLMAHPRVELANYFKYSDRSFMGWIGYDGVIKVPAWVFGMLARHTGDQHVESRLASPTYEAAPVGAVMAEHAVPEVTALASRDSRSGELTIHLVNRSLRTRYPVQIELPSGVYARTARVLSVSAAEPTAHNGRDLPPEWTYSPEFEPYSTAAPDSIHIVERSADLRNPVQLSPFSVMTVIVRPDARTDASAKPKHQDPA